MQRFTGEAPHFATINFAEEAACLKMPVAVTKICVAFQGHQTHSWLGRLINKTTMQKKKKKPTTKKPTPASWGLQEEGMRNKMNNAYLLGVGEDYNCLASSRSLQGLKMTKILVGDC